MEAISDEINQIAEAMGIDGDEISIRKAYLDLKDQDLEFLRELHQKLSCLNPEAIVSFYSHLLSFPQTRDLLPDDDTIDRLRSAQATYFEQLTNGTYDRDYVENRLKVGLVHEKVGLQPKWYLGAYCKYLTNILPQIIELYSPDVERALQVIRALMKVIFFDLGLALDTYFHAEQNTVIKLKKISDQIIACMPGGLIACDNELNVIIANTASRVFFGLGDIEPIGTSLFNYFPAEAIKEHIDYIRLTGSHKHGVLVKIKNLNGIGDKYLRVSLSTTIQNDQPAILLMFDDLTKEQKLQEEIIKSEGQLRSILDNVVDGIVTINEDGIIGTYNKSAANIFGYSKDEVIGRNINILIPEPYRSSHDGYIKKYLTSRRGEMLGAGPREVQGKRKDGSIFYMDIAISEMVISNEQYFIGIVRDITDRKFSEEEKRSLYSVVEQTADSVLITNPGGEITYVNPAFESITGYSKKEVLGQSPSVLKSGRHGADFYNRLWSAINSGKVFSDVFINCKKDGSLYYEEKTITPLRDESGNIIQFVSTGKDVTERMQVQEHFHYLANHDALTELPNRMLLMERLEQAISRGHWHNRKLGLLFLDADRFKVINDTLGHDSGDMVLKEISERLVHSIRPGDTVARLGGDEFVVLLSDIADIDDTSIVATKILDSLSRPYTLDGHELYITASIGISCYPDDGDNAISLLKNADAAMYKAKDSGRNNFQYFSSDMTMKAFERLQLECSLRGAIERNEFILYYQPQVETQSGNVVAVEALIRWEHPDKGIVSPLDFIPILEETGLIEEVGDWVFEEACQQFKKWQASGDFLDRISINLSPRQFRSKTLFDKLKGIMSKHNIDGNNLEVEITESALMESAEETIEILTALRSLGVRIAMDDFGTGYSSLSYLKRFPIDTLKIDRSFIADVPHENDGVSIVSAILSMANALGLEVIAEGVEIQEQLDFLKEKNCQFIQGYFYSKPVEPGKIVELMSQ